MNITYRLINKLCLLIILLLTNVILFGQYSIHSVGPIVDFSDALKLKVDKIDDDSKNVYIEYEVENIYNQPALLIRTPAFEFNTRTQYLDLTQFNQLNFIIGDYTFIKNPPSGRYHLRLSLLDNDTKITLSKIETIILIDSSLQSKIKDELKKVQFNIEVKNNSSFQVVERDINEQPDFTRLEIIPRLSIYDIPFVANVAFEKNWLYDSKFHIENYSVGIDYNAIKQKATQLANKKLQDILKKNNPDSIKALRNLGFNSLTDKNMDWDKMLKDYNNDTVQKWMKRMDSYSKIDSIIQKGNIQEAFRIANDSLEVYKKQLKDSLADTSAAAYKKIMKAYEYYTTVQSNYKQMLQLKDKIDGIKKQYMPLFENKDILNDFSKIDPLKDISQKYLLDKFVHSKFFDNKTVKFLYGLKDFKLGTSVINGNNQSMPGILLNGYKISYTYKKIYFHLYGGIKSDRLFFNRNNRFKSKDKAFGVTVGYGTEGLKSLELYYSYYENSYRNDSIPKSMHHLTGLSGSYTIRKKLLLSIESAVNITQNDPKIGFFAKAAANYKHKSFSFIQEAIYKSDDYTNQNVSSYSPENILLTTSVAQKLKDNTVDMKFSNIFSKRIKADSTLFNYSNLSIITLRYMHKKYPVNMVINASYYAAGYYNYPGNNNVFQLSSSANYNLSNEKSTHALNLMYTTTYNRSSVLNIIDGEAIVVTAFGKNNFLQHQLSFTDASSFKKGNSFIGRTTFTHLQMNADSTRKAIATELTYTKSNIKFFKPQVSVLYEYNKLSGEDVHTFNCTFNPVFTFKKYFFANILLSYTRNKIINNIPKTNDLRIQFAVSVRY